MKKLFALLIMMLFVFSLNAQNTTKKIIKAIIAKIDAAPANKDGTKRIIYGTWDTSKNATNIFAGYDKNNGYVIRRDRPENNFEVVLINKNSNLKNISLVSDLKKLDPNKWIAVKW